MTTRKPKLRLLSALLAVAMLFSLIPAGAVTAWAEDAAETIWPGNDFGVDQNGFSYNTQDPSKNITLEGGFKSSGEGWEFEYAQIWGDSYLSMSGTHKKYDFSKYPNIDANVSLGEYTTLLGGVFNKSVEAACIQGTAEIHGGIFYGNIVGFTSITGGCFVSGSFGSAGAVKGGVFSKNAHTTVSKRNPKLSFHTITADTGVKITSINGYPVTMSNDIWGDENTLYVVGDTVTKIDVDVYATDGTTNGTTFTIQDLATNDKNIVIKAVTKENLKSSDFTVSVDGKDLTADANVQVSYTGNAVEADAKAKDGVSDYGEITKKYYKDDGTYLGDGVAPTEPGNYEIRLAVSGGNQYNATTEDLTDPNWKFEITKGSLKPDMFQFTAPDDLIYNDKPKNAKVELVDSALKGKVGEVKELRYYTNSNTGDDSLVKDADGNPTAPTEAGTYYVRIYVEEGTHYSDGPGMGKQDWSINVKPADLTADDFELANGTVNLKDTIKGAGTVKRQYKLLDADGKPTGEYLDELPTDEGGVYQIYVTAEAGKNYNALTDPTTKKEWTIQVDGKDRDLIGDGFTATVEDKETDTAKWGQTVEIEPSDVPTGKKFDHWEISGATLDKDADQPKNSFVMGNSDVTITPKYEDIEYTLTVDGKDESHIYGDEIKVSAPKKDGYKFTGWDVSGVDVADKTSEDLDFKMPAGDVTLTPQYEKVETPKPTPGDDNPTTPEEPEKPGEENPSTPETPDKPDTPETPDKPGEPEKPDTPSTPDKPSEPEKPDTPTTPDKPSEPEKPDTPDTPDQPSEPEEPKPVVSTIYIDNGKAYGEDGETEINTAEEGQTVVIKVNPEAITEGYEFDKWEVVKGDVTLDDAASPETRFVMPAGEVELRVILKVKETPAAPTAVNPASVVVGTAVLGVGTAAVGYSTAHIATELYLKWVLPQGIIPATRGQLALLLWDKNDPTPVDNTTVYSDIDADDTNLQDAARWVIATGKMELLDDEKPDVFDPDAPVNVFAVAKAWNKTSAATK